jgi:dsRNA-specific ribonuclease
LHFILLFKIFSVINEKEDESRFLVQLKIAGKKKFFGCGITKKSAKLAAAKYAIKYLQDEEMKRKQYE